MFVLDGSLLNSARLPWPSVQAGKLTPGSPPPDLSVLIRPLGADLEVGKNPCGHWLRNSFNCQDPCWPTKHGDSLSIVMGRHVTAEKISPSSWQGSMRLGMVGCPFSHDCHQMAQSGAAFVLNSILGSLWSGWVPHVPPHFLCVLWETCPSCWNLNRLCTLQMQQSNLPHPGSGPRAPKKDVH